MTFNGGVGIGIVTIAYQFNIVMEEGIMEVKICGPGCAKCDVAYELAARVLHDKGIDEEVAKAVDFQQIAILGIFLAPVVVVDNEVKCAGRVRTEQEFADRIR